MLHSTYATHVSEWMTLKNPRIDLQQAVTNLEKPII